VAGKSFVPIAAGRQ
nr:RecName: Full=44 kDa cell wall protein [Solanum lycopersicum]